MIKILFFLVIYISVFGQIPYNQTFQVNTISNFWVSQHNVCQLDNSSFVVTWETQSGGYFGNDISAQIFKSDGSKQGSEYRVNTSRDPGTDQHNPRIAPLSDGGFVICWEREYYDRIMVQIFENDGTPRGSEIEINESGGNIWPVVASLPNGKFVIFWENFNRNTRKRQIFGQGFTNNGVKKQNSFIVNPAIDTHHRNPKVTILSYNRFAVCWESYDEDENPNNILCQIYDNSFLKVGSEFLINTNTENENYAPQISKLFSGGFVVCWMSYKSNGNKNGVYAQIFDNNGSRTGNETHVSLSKSYNYRPRVSGLSNGDFVICWTVPYPKHECIGQLFRPDGSLKGAKFQINSFPLNFRGYSSVHGLSDGGFLALWESDYQGEGFGEAIYGKYYLDSLNHPLQEYLVMEPASRIKVNTVQPKLRWQKASPLRINFPWELEYSIFLDEHENFQSPAVIDSVYDTTYTIQNLLPETTYFWKVLAKNIAGDSLLSSNVNSFSLAESLIPFSLLEPTFDQTLLNIKPKLLWEHASGIKYGAGWNLEYFIYLSKDETFTNPTIFSSTSDTSISAPELFPGTTYFWKVLAKDILGDSLWSSNTIGFFVDWNATAIDKLRLNKPKKFKLYQNYPNPFNSSTSIKFNAKETSRVILRLFDIRGRIIAEILNKVMGAGHHKINFHADNLPSGIYFYNIKMGNFTKTRKMLLTR
jgi:hypothetical protein